MDAEDHCDADNRSKSGKYADTGGEPSESVPVWKIRNGNSGFSETDVSIYPAFPASASDMDCSRRQEKKKSAYGKRECFRRI